MKTNFSKFIFCLTFLWIVGASKVLMAQESSDSLRISSSFFTEEQYTAWNKLYDVWRYNFFYDCLSESNLHFNCAHCEGAYLDIVFQIDDKGFVKDYQIVH